MKKWRERYTVEALLGWLGQPTSALKDWQRENPDAIIEINGELIGVEVTTILPEFPSQRLRPQMWTAEANRIVGKTRDAYHSRHPEPLNVRIGFRPDWEPQRDSTVLVDELMELVERNARELASRAAVGPAITSRNPHPAVSWLYVNRTRFSALWEPSFVFTDRYASAGDIHETVRGKEARLSEYRLAVPKVWLAINCDLTGQEVAFDIPRPDFVVMTGFDRVFCCGFGMYQWVELLTVNPQA